MHRSKTASLFNDLLVEDSEAVLAILIAREYPQRHRTKPFNRCLGPLGRSVSAVLSELRLLSGANRTNVHHHRF